MISKVGVSLLFVWLLGITQVTATSYLSGNRLVLDTDAVYYFNGNVGMGTTLPLGALDIAKKNNADYLLNFINTHTGSAVTGFGFYGGALTSITDGALSIRRINGYTESGNTNIMVFASQNIGIGTFAAPNTDGTFTELPTLGKLQVSGNAYIGIGPTVSTTNYIGYLQKPDGKGAAFLASSREEISFGYDHTTSYFKILVNNQAIQFSNNGGSAKTFVISHPDNPNLHLVHAMQELPESVVQYVGSAQLKNGQAVITLPGYFEALTRDEGRQIRLSPVDGFDVLKIKFQSGKSISNGRFIVISNNPKSNQSFDWEVTAIRGDVPPLNPTPLKSSIQIKGHAPYMYAEPLP